MSKYLIDDKNMIVFPKLAKAIGLNESLMLQQMHYWLLQKKNPKEGYYWVYNSYQDWVDNDFIFWSHSTVKRVIKSLEEQGLVISVEGIFNKRKGDKTKWYRIDYNKLDEITSQFETFDGTVKGYKHSGQVDQSKSEVSGQNDYSSGQVDQNTRFNMTRPLPEITPEITKHNISSDKSEEVDKVMKVYKSLNNLPEVVNFTTQRKKAIKARINSNGLETVIAVLEMLDKDQYYSDRNAEGANWYHFNYIFNPEKFTMLVERKNKLQKSSYNNNNTNNQQQATQYEAVSIDNLFEDA